MSTDFAYVEDKAWVCQYFIRIYTNVGQLVQGVAAVVLVDTCTTLGAQTEVEHTGTTGVLATPHTGTTTHTATIDPQAIAVQRNCRSMRNLVARFIGPTWGPSGADRTQVGPMLAP